MAPSEIAEIARYAESFGQRFGQYLDNVITTQTNHADLFNITNEELLAACRAYFAAYGKDGA